MLLSERLDTAIEELAGEAIGDPLTVANLQLALGISLRELGYPEKALALFIKARKTYTALQGPEHPDTLSSMNDLGLAYLAAGKTDLALPLLQETFQKRKAKLGPDDANTRVSMNNLATAYGSADKPRPGRGTVTGVIPVPQG